MVDGHRLKTVNPDLHNRLNDFNDIFNIIYLLFYLIKLQNIKMKLASVSFCCKTSAIKRQKSKFCPQILSTEPNFYVYDMPVTANMIAIISNFVERRKKNGRQIFYHTSDDAVLLRY